MNVENRRKANRRVFQTETLEGRLLLSNSTPRPAITGILRSLGGIKAGMISGIQGQVSGTRASDGLYGGTLPGYDSYSGHGPSSVADVLYGTTFLVNPGATASDPSTIENGSAVFRSGYRGDQIQVTFTGESQSRFPGRASWAIQGQIMGGSGRYDGVTGKFSGTLTTLGGPAGVNGSFRLSYNLRFDQPV